MSLQNENYLNQLLTTVPEGVAVPSSWLESRGYSRQLVYRYQKSGWLTKLGRGAFCRPASEITWQGVVLGMQRLAGLPLHVGGITALNQQGFAHYLPLGGERHIHLWGKGKLPAWVTSIGLSERFVVHTRPLFPDDKEPQGLVELPTRARDWTLMVSGPERAILETLNEVRDTDASFTFAAELFEGLATLRPKRVNQLLQSCYSVKAKRLFLFLAEYYNHGWVKYLETDKIELGKGKRQVVKQGRYDRKFLITVPEQFGAMDDETEEG